MKDVQFKFHEDLEPLTSPTDRIPTIRMSAMVKQRMQETGKEKIYTEQKTLRRQRHRGEPIFARVPLLIFLCVLTFYLFMVVRGLGALLYLMVMLGSKLGG